ncbi:MAG: lipid-A-disaccharide synthase [Flavobacteriales bacterium]|nr:lipid-A-disaccharide synthase [Flavobacteriales bacterium]
MKVYIIAGEASGDIHGANLVSALRAENPDIQFRGWGGDRMSEEGVDVVRHIRDLAFMGFAEVLLNLKTILSNISFCKKDIRRFRPDAVILVDYPGFNLRIAPFAKKLGAKTFYYISPQVWAWKSNRVHAIKKYVDELYAILPFEQEFYKKYDMDVQYVGHPLLDEIERQGLDERKEEEVVALLPGSRKQEIKKMLPAMAKAAAKFPDKEFLVAAAPNIDDTFYKPMLNEHIRLHRNGMYQLLRKSKAALVTSGTATLETALIGTPQVVCYKGSEMSFQIAKRLVKLNYISLVNLIMDEEVVKELIQAEMNPNNLILELRKIIGANEHRESMIEKYDQLKEKLGGPGASSRCAKHLLKNMTDSPFVEHSRN